MSYKQKDPSPAEMASVQLSLNPVYDLVRAIGSLKLAAESLPTAEMRRYALDLACEVSDLLSQTDLYLAPNVYDICPDAPF